MKNKKGFTLIELLAVIVVLAVIAIVAITSIGPMLEKSRKSGLGTEGISLIYAAEDAFNAESMKGTKAEYNSTSSVCYTVKYLCEHGFYEKGCNEDGYSGSVLVEYKGNGKYEYAFWLTNGTYSFAAANKNNFGDVENPTIVYDGSNASTDCGLTMPSNTPDVILDANNKFVSNTVLALGGGKIKSCDTTCIDKIYEIFEETNNEISFTINGEKYTTTNGTTWGEWILQSGGSSTGNNVIWVSPTAGYSDEEIKTNPVFNGGVWSHYRNDTKENGRYLMLYMELPSRYGGNLPTEDFVKLSGDIPVIQTYTNVIEENGIYGGIEYIKENYLRH